MGFGSQWFLPIIIFGIVLFVLIVFRIVSRNKWNNQAQPATDGETVEPTLPARYGKTGKPVPRDKFPPVDTKF
jgi:uncharacterized membrane protein